MKKFTGQSENSSESSIRKGFSVPDGAVNIAWVKSPKLNPKNNIIMIDTSKAISENVNNGLKTQRIALANPLGILEDLNGNQIWDEEYPVISDLFLNDNNSSIFNSNTVLNLAPLPYMHVSRFFHIDTAGLSSDILSEYLGEDIKVIDSGGRDYKDENGDKLYKVYLVSPDQISTMDGSRNIVYRVYIFLDIEPESQDLYLIYNKAELSQYDVIKNQQINYVELINPRKYFNYLPEETDVIDHYNYHSKVYSSKPAMKKEEIIGTSTNSSFGWKYYVPKKAIPDPRIFQTFKWRLGCEFTEVRSTAVRKRNIDPTNPQYPIIKAGVVIPPNGNELSTRANYLFYQLNITDYNTAGVRFINPLKSISNSYNPSEQIHASYWHVDINSISADDLSKFDILIFAPAGEFDISPYISKINNFTLQGGTFIIETSSTADVRNIYTDVTLSPNIINMADSTIANYVQPSSLKLSDLTPEDATDNINDYLQSQVWPPNIADVINNFRDTASILREASAFSGWNLTQEEIDRISAYEGSDHVKFQYIDEYTGAFVPILEGIKVSTGEEQESKVLMVHQKYLNGGNLFISTACIFEDHLMTRDVGSTTSSTTLSLVSSQQNRTIPAQLLDNYNEYCSASYLSAEMKLRINIMLYATLFNPSNQNNNRFSVYDNRLSTIFTDWQSSWVIDGSALLEDEINQYNFVLQTASPTNPTPVWKRSLSTKSIKNLIDEKVKQSEETKHLADLTNRKYYLITTNENVIIPNPDEIRENDLPTAWTNVESPKLDESIYLGKYVIKNEMVETSSQVSVSNQIDRFPSRPYAFQSSLISLESKEESLEKTVSFTLQGEYTTFVPGEDEIISTPTLKEVVKNWKDSGGQTNKGTKSWQDGWPNPIGIETYTDENYKSKIPTNFPYLGLKGLLYHVDPPTATLIMEATKTPGLSKYDASRKITINTVTNGFFLWPFTFNQKDFISAGSNPGINFYSNPNYSNAGLQPTGEVDDLGRETFKSVVLQDVLIYKQIPVSIKGETEITQKLLNTSFSVFDLPLIQMVDRTKQYSSKGLNVKRVQMILNELIKDKQLKGPYLKVDGVYGAVTAAKVKLFQRNRKAFWIDGIVDSETWSLLGYSLVGLLDKGWIPPNDELRRMAETAKSYITLSSISDNSNDSGYVRHSWVSGGPSAISETFKINLNITDPIRIHGLVITPWLADSKADTVEIDYLYIGDDISLKNYKFSDHPNLLANKIIAKTNEEILIDLKNNVREGTCVIIKLTQRNKAGWGTSRVLGLKEVGIKTFEMTTENETRPGVPVEKSGTFSHTYRLTFGKNTRSVEEIDASSVYRNSADLRNSNIRESDIVKLRLIENVTFENPNDSFSFDYRFEDDGDEKVQVRLAQEDDPPPDGDGYTYTIEDDGILYRVLKSKKFVIRYQGADLITEQNTTNGPKIGTGDYRFYTKKLNSEEIDNSEKTYGYIRASDGILLVCDENGNPFGFPDITTLNISDENDIQYYSLSLDTFNIDQFTKVGFYDISPDDPSRRGFIYDSYGYSNISYYDYVRRGVQNIYIAVQTGYELDALGNLGANMVTVPRPFSWKMPIYNITLNTSSKVQLNPLPENLSVDDIWYIPVKCGTFTKTIEIPSKQYSSVVGYLNRYQNTKIKAYYNIPESKSSTWSSLFGKPYIDVVGEIPEILDDFTIKFKFGNILTVQYPLEDSQSKHSSPWRPIFTIYRRDSLFSQWKQVPMSQIRDYNLSSGTIIFNNRIIDNDPRLMKVDYTCERKEFIFKYDSVNNQYVNLNPYININPDWLNRALYVYMVPEYIYDLNNRIIEESKTTSVIRITNDSFIFNPTDVAYDPTAVMLGIIYVSTSFNIDDLAIIDTRKRGGGIYAHYDDKEMEKLQFEYNSYWDVVPSHVTAYQKGGFVIIRLPAELKNDFTVEEIKDVIDKNISAGVAYKIEDLQGNKWEL